MAQLSGSLGRVSRARSGFAIASQEARRWMRRAVWVWITIPEWFRYFEDRFVLIPCADLLPRAWALRIASRLAWLDAVLTPEGRQATAEMRIAFGMVGSEARAGAARLLAVQRRDLVYLRRVARGRDKPKRWRVEHRGNEEARDAFLAGGPGVLVSAHFGLAPLIMTTKATGIHVDAAAVRAVPLRRLNPFLHRWQYRAELLSRAGAPETTLWARADDVWAGTKLLRIVRKGGLVLLMGDVPSADAHPLVRDFAGYTGFRAHLGPAHLARAARVPLLFGIAMEPQGETIVVEWMGIVRPGDAGESAEADVRVTNQFLDQFETFLGKNPTSYAYRTGCERKWDPKQEAWAPVPPWEKRRKPRP